MAKSTDLSGEEARVRAAIRAYIPNDRYATVNNPAFYTTPTKLTTTREKLHNSIIEQYVAKIVKAGADAEGIVLAGPPGAGKSTALRTTLDASGFIVIDADELKSLLLQDMVKTGDIESIMTPEVKALVKEGIPVFPAEMATAVHTESGRLKNVVMREVMREKANIVLDGAMSVRGVALATNRRFMKSKYTYGIVNVEINQDLARQSARQRWQTSRREALADPSKGCDARFLASSVVINTFENDGGSKTMANTLAMVADKKSAATSWTLYYDRDFDHPYQLDIDHFRESMRKEYDRECTLAEAYGEARPHFSEMAYPNFPHAVEPYCVATHEPGLEIEL